MSTPKPPELTDAQRQRLITFAEQHGKCWRSKLKRLWWSGADDREPDGHLLRQVRNTIGPSRLDDVRF